MTDQEVTAEISGGRILAKVPWMNGRGRDMAKAIPGHQPLWDKSGPKDVFIGWTYPIAWSSCVQLRKTFGDSLRVGPQLTRWAWSEHRRREHMEHLRSELGTDLPRVAQETPGLMKLLEGRPFQITGTAFVTSGRQVCLGDAPRLGKTYQALAAVVETDVRTTLVACPKTATYAVWDAKVAELLPGHACFVAQGGRKEREQQIESFRVMAASGAPSILVVNKEMLRVVRYYGCDVGHHFARNPGQTTRARMSRQRPGDVPAKAKFCEKHQVWEHKTKPGRKGGCDGFHDHKITYHAEYEQLFGITFDAVILDECHHALASEKNRQSADITQIRLGAVRLKMAPNALKLAMSGTPFRSMLTKAWGVLNWLRPDVFTSFWQFAERNFKVTQGRFGMEIDRTDLLDATAFDEELRPYYLARDVADVAPQLPPITYVDVSLPMEGEQARIYRKMAKDAEADIQGGRITATGILAELTRRRQFACSCAELGEGRKVYPILPSNKLDWVIQFLEEREARGIKVVIASSFTELVNLFADALRAKGYSVSTITGETSARGRAEVMNDFLTGDTQICIINTFAGGETIDLASADEMIFLDEPWTDDPKQQAENRIRSLSKDRPLTVFHLRSKGTVEEWIAELTQDQRAILMSARPKARDLMQEAL